MLGGCVSLNCEGRGPEVERACYECVRQAVMKSSEADPHTGSRVDVKSETANCLRERGYFNSPNRARPPQLRAPQRAD